MFKLELRLASSLFLVGGLWALPSSQGMAQSNIVPDQSLGAERSRVIPNAGGLPREEIQGGAQRGANLFHSFRNFSIEAGRGAFFANPAGVANILSRVTGRNLSDINGTLGVLGNADFFLINPNGILFGPNASLDLSGSFLASTASKITFPDGRDFDAQVGQEPAVLSINIPQGLQWGNQSAPVTVQGASLSLEEGQSLGLAGGDVRIEDGDLEAPGGRVNLIGVAADGVIEFGGDGDFIISEDVARTNVLFTNSSVDVSSNIGGDISITAKNVDILEGSSIFSRIEGDVEVQSGDISINSTENVLIDQSNLSNYSLGKGNAGDIDVKTNSLILQNGASLFSIADGGGDAGIVKISASDSVLLEGENSQGIPSPVLSLVNPNARSTVLSAVNPDAKGNAGSVEINTRSLILNDGAVLSVSTFGEGDAGIVKISASDSVLLQGQDSQGNSSSVVSQVNPDAKGNAGSVEIDTRSLILDGTFLNANTLGEGDAGTVKIRASDLVLLQGVAFGGFGANITSQVFPGATGNAGSVEIDTRSLILKDGAFLDASTFAAGDASTSTVKIHASDSVVLQGVDPQGFGASIQSLVGSDAKGNAGGVEIDTRLLILKDGAFLDASTAGEGNAGTVNIRASDSVLLQGQDSQETPSFVASQVSSGGTGNAGGVEIDTRSLILKDGAFLDASTFGEGNAGTVKIYASDSVVLQGVDSQGFGVALGSQVGPDAKGNGGGVEIDTRSLILQDGANLNTSTVGEGDAGNFQIKSNTISLIDGSRITSSTGSAGVAGSIILKVQDDITISGEDTGVFSNTTASSTGNGGSIFIDPVSVTIHDGAQIAVDSQGAGTGGDINLIAGSLTLDQGTISAETASNLGGNIELDIDNLLLLRNNSLISATAGTDQAGGDGGNIDIDTALLVAFPLENSDITADAFEGNGGNIQITAQGVFGTEFRDQPTPLSDITASSNSATDGTVQLDTSLDPTSGLVDLPVQPPQPQQVAQTCTPGGSGAQSEFVYTGRGGLPPQPQQVLNQPEIEVDWVGLAPHTNRENQSQSQPKNIPENQAPTPSLLSPELSSDALSLSKTTERGLSNNALSLSKGVEAPSPTQPPQAVNKQTPATPQIVEAQGWVSTDDGKVILTSSTTTPPYHLSQKVCPSR